MERNKTIYDISIALGIAIKDVERAVDNLVQAKIDSDELMAQIEAMDKSMRNTFQPCKSYESPYSKFEKFRRKKKR